ncbi:MULTISPECIES: hypothetical protein [Synechococcaceae]|jgi:hypothetical protein|uniref:hypothetical protein n=1 Tax=Synechococcaceae TaxID=1890426 RepID=UPI001FF86AD6|nr:MULTISPECIES: hypothetical protein [Synechococcaceae]UPH90602.1 hypothetical protein LY254_02535 [Synechococcus sp. NB0720_010]
MFFYELNVTLPQRILRVPLQAETQEQAWHLSRDLFPDHDLKLVPRQRKCDPEFWAI